MARAVSSGWKNGLLFAAPLPTLKHPSPSTQQSTIFLKAWLSCQFAMQAGRKGKLTSSAECDSV